MAQVEIKNFSEFWLFYASEHSNTLNRALHFIGSISALIALTTLIGMGRWYLFPLALIPGYGFAWFGHFFVEKNKPASFKYPLWSFIADWKMVAMILTGRMSNELEKAKNFDFTHATEKQIAEARTK